MRGLRRSSGPAPSRFLWPGVLSVVLAVGAMAPPATVGAASVEHDECVRRLLEAPIGEATPPKGWKWQGLSMGEYYWPSMPDPAGWFGGLRRKRSGSSEYELFMSLSCQPNVDLLLERTAEVAPLSGARMREVKGVGDEAVALVGGESWSTHQDFAGYPTILWRSGDVFGRVVGPDRKVLKAFAAEVSDVLASAGLAGPPTDDDACVRRLLGAPIETLAEPEGQRLYTFPTVTPTWGGFMPGELPWSEPSFTLSCQPEAALVVDRAPGLHEWGWGVEYDGWVIDVDVGPIGDAAAAHERFEVDEGKSEGVTLWWHVGDVLGRIDVPASELASAEAFAREVTALILGPGAAPRVASTPEHRACVQRLLDAPIERLDDWGSLSGNLRLGWVHPSANWAGGYYLQQVELSCQPNAAIIMDRALDLAVTTGGRELEHDPIGDRSLALGRRGSPTILWREGDVLGSVYLGQDLSTTTAFAHRVNAAMQGDYIGATGPGSAAR